MKKIKSIIILLAVAIIIIMIAATITESVKGTPFAHEQIYDTWWFVVIWASLAAVSAIYIIRRRLFERKIVFCIHASFLVILLGALLSYLTAESGTVHLRKGEQVQTMKIRDGETADLGFNLSLKDFRILYYPGTDAAQDYISELQADGNPLEVSMNSIGSYNGYRFTQSSYDDDMQGSTLSVLHDPWGIGVTYVGYAMLFISFIASILCKRTRMQTLYRKAIQNHNAPKVVILATMMSLASFTTAMGQENLKIDQEICNEFGKISVLYNSRICPINTVAIDFVTKMCGKPSWNGMSANEVFAGWVFDVPYWETAKMVEIKDKKAQEILGLNGKWASFTDFWNEYNEYKLEKPLKEAYKNGDKAMQKSLRDADEKYNIIRMLYQGEMLKMFPYKGKAAMGMEWYAPGQPLPGVHLPEDELMFVRKSMDYLAESIITGDKARALDIAKKIYNYQHVRAKEVMPSKTAVSCEIFYNSLNSQRWPVMLYLAMALAIVIMSFFIGSDKYKRFISWLTIILPVLMLLHTTLLLALRWLVSGHLPMSNGYETMQFLAWATLLVTLFMRRRFEPIALFGPLLASFAMLVAMITDGNPQITQLMPVLQSPLLSVHVMVIMFAYALFGLMALISIQGMLCHHKKNTAKEEQLAALSQLLLYPAVALLSIGIFIGAIWANVSWGKYWSWDSKETWALITMLIYAAPLHADLKWMRKPIHIHLYMLLAFLSVLMTYFGVNYFLAGMHSYA